MLYEIDIENYFIKTFLYENYKIYANIVATHNIY